MTHYELTEEQLTKLNKTIDDILKEYPNGISHRTRGEFIGKLKKNLKDLNIRGEGWLAEIMKRRGLK